MDRLMDPYSANHPAAQLIRPQLLKNLTIALCGYGILFFIPGILEVHFGLQGLEPEYYNCSILFGAATLAQFCIVKGFFDVAFALSAAASASGIMLGVFRPVPGGSVMAGLIPTTYGGGVFNRACVVATAAARILQRILLLFLVVAYFSTRALSRGDGEDVCPSDLLNFAWWWFYEVPFVAVFAVPAITFFCGLIVAMRRRRR